MGTQVVAPRRSLPIPPPGPAGTRDDANANAGSPKRAGFARFGVQVCRGRLLRLPAPTTTGNHPPGSPEPPLQTLQGPRNAPGLRALGQGFPHSAMRMGGGGVAQRGSMPPRRTAGTMHTPPHTSSGHGFSRAVAAPVSFVILSERRSDIVDIVGTPRREGSLRGILRYDRSRDAQPHFKLE